MLHVAITLAILGVTQASSPSQRTKATLSTPVASTSVISAPQNELDIFDKDIRFQKKLTFFNPVITIKDTLALLETETGVPFRISAPEEDQMRELCICLDDTSLQSTSQSLSALLSYKQARWRWSKRTNEQGQVYYLLSAPVDKEAMVTAARQEVDASFVKVLNDSKRVLSYSNEGLKDYGNKNSELAFLKNLTSANLESWKSGMNIFHNVLTEEQRQSVLSGNPVSILGSSNPSVQSFIETLWERGRTTGQPCPDAMEIRLSRYPGEVAPEINISAGQYGGDNFVGGPFNEQAWRKKIGGEWITRYDMAQNANEAKSIPELTSVQIEKEKKLPEKIEPLAVMIWRLSQATHTPIIALLKQRTPGMSVTYVSTIRSPEEELPYGKEFGKVLESLEYPRLKYTHKWNSGVVLLRNPMEPFAPSQKEMAERNHKEFERRKQEDERRRQEIEEKQQSQPSTPDNP